MALNQKCPKCGSNNVQLSNIQSKHGCLWFILFGWIFVVWVLIKWMIGFMVLFIWDIWMAIIHAIMKKGYVWKYKRWFSNRTKTYYCHACGHNFKG